VEIGLKAFAELASGTIVPHELGHTVGCGAERLAQGKFTDACISANDNILAAPKPAQSTVYRFNPTGRGDQHGCAFSNLRTTIDPAQAAVKGSYARCFHSRVGYVLKLKEVVRSIGLRDDTDTG
jgi:hypothetical protein